MAAHIVEERRFPSLVIKVLIVAISVTGLYLAAIVCAGPLLTIRNEPAQSDVIVVLGGDGPARSDLAARLYARGLAPNVLVSGDGDCTSIAVDMARQGVDPAAINLECSSGNTEENALFSRPILSAMDVRRAIIVTSWFHSRRAVTTFETVMPSIEWLSVPTEPAGGLWQKVWNHQSFQVVKEYPKTVVYALRRLLRLLGTAEPLAGMPS